MEDWGKVTGTDLGVEGRVFDATLTYSFPLNGNTFSTLIVPQGSLLLVT